MDKEIINSIRKFLESFEQVFDKDWDYTKEQLGVYEETAEQKENSAKMGLEAIYSISPDGTFLNPKVDDETEDWGYRGALLENYIQLKQLIAQVDL